MFKLLGALAALTSSVAGGAGQDPGPAPINLIVEPAGEGIRVQVVGASYAPYAAAFTLEVTSGGNRSLHRGSAALEGGGKVTLSTVTLGNAAPGQWKAHLAVQPEGSEPYDQVRTSL